MLESRYATWRKRWLDAEASWTSTPEPSGKTSWITEPVEEARFCRGYQKCGRVVERGCRQPLSCHPQCRGTRSTKLDMITYKRGMLPGLQPLNSRWAFHRIKVNTEPLFRASEVGRCEKHNTSDPLPFISLFIKIPEMKKKKKVTQHTKQWWEGCALIEGSVVGSLGEGHQRVQIHTP